ncbi:NACHT domain-containing protein [Priestia aryabhattai]|uniref:NACHT domain-containing protein n=1 Tax=Priestia aryabhattai TaxID=412384 RepID=UPI003D2B4EB8
MAENIGLDINKITVELVQKNIDKLTVGLSKFGKDQLKKLKLKTGLAFESYLSTATKKYGYSKTILYRDKIVALYDFYIPMNLKCGEEIIDTSNVRNLIDKNKFITVYGSGGIGKSTLFKHLFMNTIVNKDLIPIFVELRMMNDEEITLIDCIYKSLNNLKFDLEQDYFEQSLNSGRYLILLDGFDEIIDNKREKLIKEIIALTDKYDENHYILSSRRSDALYNGWNKSINFDLVPLDKEKAIALIDRLDYNFEVKNKFLYELENNLFKRHNSFCSNPLLLNLMLLTYEEFAEIPEKVHIFYSNAFAVLYSKHDATKAFKRQHRTSGNLGYDEFVKILSAMSALSYMESDITFDYPTLTKYINNSKKITKIDNFSSEDFITDIVESICLLYLDGLKYNFQHRSFQEFFTAKFILNLPDKKQFDIISKLIDKRYGSLESDNVLNLIIEMEREKFEKVFLIPKLKEIRDHVQGENEEVTYYNYLTTAFRSYELNYTIMDNPGALESGKHISFLFKRKNRKYYKDLLSYIIQKYKDIYSFIELPEPNLSYKRIDIIEEYGELDEELGLINVDIDIIPNNEELMRDFLAHSKFYIMEYNFGMHLLETLEEKHRETDNILGELFGIDV